MNSPVYLYSSHSPYLMLTSPNGTSLGTLQINLEANAVVEGFQIPTDVGIKLHELKNESSIIHVQFFGAEVQYSKNDTGIQNKIVPLHITGNNGTHNTYYAGPILTYPNDGKFKVLLTIEKNSTQNSGKNLNATSQPLEFPFDSLISINSYQAYQIQQQSNFTTALSFLVIGLSIISITSVITKIIDYCDKFFEISRKTKTEMKTEDLSKRVKLDP